MLTLPYHREPCHGESVPGGEAAVTVRDLSVVMPGDDQLALDGVSLTVPIGARVALVGPNGAGKSTLLKSIVGLLRPQSGSIRVYGMEVGSCYHRVAYLPQRSEIDWRFPMMRRLVESGRYVHLGWLRRPGRVDRDLVARRSAACAWMTSRIARSASFPVASSSGLYWPGHLSRERTSSSSTNP